MAPALSLLLTSLLSLLIDGPGSLAFPVLPLLWCALSYSIHRDKLNMPENLAGFTTYDVHRDEIEKRLANNGK